MDQTLNNDRGAVRSRSGNRRSRFLQGAEQSPSRNSTIASPLHLRQSPSPHSSRSLPRSRTPRLLAIVSRFVMRPIMLKSTTAAILGQEGRGAPARAQAVQFASFEVATQASSSTVLPQYVCFIWGLATCTLPSPLAWRTFISASIRRCIPYVPCHFLSPVS